MTILLRRIPRSDVDIATASHVGLVREVNEDACAFAEPADDTLFRQTGRLLVLADGMGGEAAGRLAADLLIESVATIYFEQMVGANDEKTAFTALQRGIEYCAARMDEAIDQHPEWRGMGTTAVCVACLPERLIIANIGDSRAYRLRDATLQQLTRDHSALADAIASGLTPDEARRQVPSNLLTRAVGGGGLDVRPDRYQYSFRPGDRLLLCSDGLHGLVSHEHMTALLGRGTVNDAAASLMAAALDRGGDDNVTLMILEQRRTQSVGPEVRSQDAEAAPATPESTSRRAEPSDERPLAAARRERWVPWLEWPTAGGFLLGLVIGLIVMPRAGSGADETTELAWCRLKSIHVDVGRRSPAQTGRSDDIRVANQVIEQAFWEAAARNIEARIHEACGAHPKHETVPLIVKALQPSTGARDPSDDLCTRGSICHSRTDALAKAIADLLTTHVPSHPNWATADIWGRIHTESGESQR